jgi:hypothetical protein
MIRLVIFLLLLSQNTFSFEIKEKDIKMDDLIAALNLNIMKYQLDLPATKPGEGYGLRIYIERYDGAANRTQKIIHTSLGLGHSNKPNLLIRYPDTLEEETKGSEIFIATDVNTTAINYYQNESESGAVAWTKARNLEIEFDREFIIALRIQGFDGSIKTSDADDLQVKLNELKKQGVDSVYIIKGVVVKLN